MTADHSSSAGWPMSAGWRPHPRYPDPAIEVLDERFAPYRIFSAAVERRYTGCRWAEGPVWLGDGRFLLWSDTECNFVDEVWNDVRVAARFRQLRARVDRGVGRSPVRGVRQIFLPIPDPGGVLTTRRL